MGKQEAIKILKEFHDKSALFSVRTALETVLPELKEDEDERIRKELITHCRNTRCVTEEGAERIAKWIAWLEKQGGKYSGGTSKEWTISDAATFKELIDFLENGTAKLQHDITRYANWLKIQLAPKVKPKFNVGEWITNSIETVQITGYDIDYGYQVDYKGNLQHRDTDIIEKEYHLWTIADAKDGDVLAYGDKVTDCPFIFHNLNEELNPRSYCGVNTLRHFQDNDENGGSWCNSDGVRPATKEQRDLLFQKMKEAGYEWSEETHQLKKIENTRPMLSDFFNAEYERGKASFANRQLYNRAILAILSNYVEKYPDIRFGQMLCNLDVNPHFDEESKEAYWNLCKTINKRK